MQIRLLSARFGFTAGSIWITMAVTRRNPIRTMSSLQEQLLKAGLVDDKKLARAKQEKERKARQTRKNSLSRSRIVNLRASQSSTMGMPWTNSITK